MWLKSTAGLNSFKRGSSVNLSRPVVLFDVPGRGRARHLTRYAYVQTVTWPCTLYVDTLGEAVRYQEALVSDLEDRCNAKYNFSAKLKDPTSKGEEYIMFIGVSFDSAQLMSFELGELGEIEMDFTFDDFKYLKSIN